MIDPLESGSHRSPARSRRVTDETLFRYLIDFETDKAQRLQYCISVVCLGSDLAPPEASRLSTSHILEVILRRTRATDAVTPLPEASFAVLLIDADTACLTGIITRLKEELSALTGPATWSAGSACYPKTAAGDAELLRQALHLMTRARQDGGDRFDVAS